MTTSNTIDFSADASNLFAVLKDFPQQILAAHQLGEQLKFTSFDNIVFSGMGGSSIGGMLLQSYLSASGFNKPFIVVRDYSIPAFVNEKTLFVACSYSGNTEETLSCYKKARTQHAQIIAMSSGGKLKEWAQKDTVPFISLPQGMQPRNAVAYAFFPLLRGLMNSKYYTTNDTISELIKILGNEKHFVIAEKIARKLQGSTPIIYGSPIFNVVAYRWKTQFNENAKTLSYHHEFPELNHNELNGFTNIEGPFHIIILKSAYEHPRVEKRIQLTKEIVGKKISVTELHLSKESLLSQIFTALYIGDLTSFYLAMLYKTDPTPVPVIEEFKKEMGSYL